MRKSQRNIKLKIYGSLIGIVIILLLILNNNSHSALDTIQKELKEVLQNQEGIVDYIQDDSIIYTLIHQSSRSEYGDLLVIFRQEETGKWDRSYENDFADLKPWKIELADIDGDGEKEILTAVHKTTHYDSTVKNRIFVFNYRDNKLIKKWTGSQIAGVWENFIVGDLLSIPGEELIFIEQLEEGRERICIYYWFDFGFLLLAESDDYVDITDFSILEENNIRITYKAKQGVKQDEVATLMVKDGKIIESNPTP